MSENNNKFESDYDSLKDVREFQENMFNPGHYIGTGKVSPMVSAPGNATPMVVMHFIFTVIFAVLGGFALWSDIENKIALALIFFVFSIFSLIFGFAYFKKAKKYNQTKKALQNEDVTEEATNQLWQRTCPKCGETHDIDYPKCPNCKHNYLK